MAKPKQKMIVTTEIGKDGNIAVDISFFPALPDLEAYKKMSEEKQGLVAIINQFAKNTQDFINRLSGERVPLKEPASANSQQG